LKAKRRYDPWARAEDDSTHFNEPHRLSEGELRLMELLTRQGAEFVERNAEEALRRVERDLRNSWRMPTYALGGPEAIIVWANRADWNARLHPRRIPRPEFLRRTHHMRAL
jgi:hypothetical protein